MARMVAGLLACGMAGVPSIASSQAASSRPAVVVAAGVARQVDAARLGLRFEPGGTAWRFAVGGDLWFFVVGCDAGDALPECEGPRGVSANGAVRWFPIRGGRVEPYLGAGLGLLRRDGGFAVTPDAMAGLEFATGGGVALRVEARHQAMVRRERIDAAGNQGWRTVRGTGVGLEVRIFVGRH